MYEGGTAFLESSFEPEMSAASLRSGTLSNLCSRTPTRLPSSLAAPSSALAVPWISIVSALAEYPSLLARHRHVAESMPPESRTMASVSSLLLFPGGSPGGASPC
jgi:hypothetical protein